MATFTDLLSTTLASLHSDTVDPDGPTVRRGLLLAAHAGLTIDRCETTTAHWDLYALSVSNALTTLQCGLPNDLLLSSDIPDAGEDDRRMRDLIRSLVSQLANRYAEAAAGFSGGQPGSPVRRLVWAEVANYLDDAAAHLP